MMTQPKAFSKKETNMANGRYQPAIKTEWSEDELINMDTKTFQTHVIKFMVEISRALFDKKEGYLPIVDKHESLIRNGKIVAGAIFAVIITLSGLWMPKLIKVWTHPDSPHAPVKVVADSSNGSDAGPRRTSNGVIR